MNNLPITLTRRQRMLRDEVNSLQQKYRTILRALWGTRQPQERSLLVDALPGTVRLMNQAEADYNYVLHSPETRETETEARKIADSDWCYDDNGRLVAV